jgi:hypothetical protein
LVDAAGDAAKRAKTQAGRVAPKGCDKEEQRRDSEEETRHERMNPVCKNRGTVGRVTATAAWKQAVGGLVVSNPIAHEPIRHTML